MSSAPQPPTLPPNAAENARAAPASLAPQPARLPEDTHGPQGKPYSSGQFALLGQRRFLPFFLTQFFGAANDNLFKFAFTALVTYRIQLDWLPTGQAAAVIGGVFILPFVLFSATAGQWADRTERSRIFRHLKLLEIAVVLFAALGFYLGNHSLLLACIFLMGLQSSLFGPAKYAYLPQHFDEHELTGSNGMVEMGTFLAILLGNICGGVLMDLQPLPHALGWVAGGCIALALLGWLASLGIPHSPAPMPDLKLNFNPFSETINNLKLAARYPSVLRSLFGISWMWFFGVFFLTEFPTLGKEIIGGDIPVVTLLLAVFSVSIAVGSLLCETFSRRTVEIGLVPCGAFGMTIFTALFCWHLTRLPVPDPAHLLTLGEFLRSAPHCWLMIDLALIAFCTGLYSVPMYALMQLRTPAAYRARVTATNNILNAGLMVICALLLVVLDWLGLTIPQIFAVLALLNLLVTSYIFWLVPEYLLRLLMLFLTRIVYRLRLAGTEHLPIEGAAILICNHVSFADAVLLAALSPRPTRFVMDHRIFQTPLFGTFFRLVKAIPMAPQKEDPAAYARAFEQVAQALEEGELVCIFPEGRLTPDGTLQAFRPGILKILERNPVPVIPAALHNLWGSFFSRIDGRAMSKPLRRGVRNTIGINVAPPIPAEQATLERMESAVRALLAVDMMPAAVR